MGVSKKQIFFIVLLAFIYLLFSVYLRNTSLINTTLLSKYPLLFKLKLYTALFEGMLIMSKSDLILLPLLALLTATNLLLIVQKISLLRKVGNVHFVAGGGSLVGIISGGCASCGLPVVSLLGLGGSMSVLPFKGAELPYISLVLLSFSLYLLLKRKDAPVSQCAINEKKHVSRKK